MSFWTSHILASQMTRGGPTGTGFRCAARISLLLACIIVVVLGVFSQTAAFAAPSDTIHAVKPSVVAVGTFQKARSPQFNFLGTGFAVGDGTLIATNAHVVAQVLNAERFETYAIVIPGADGGPQVREARKVASDPEHDIAVLKISGSPLPALKVQDRVGVRDGDGFLFTGFPIGGVLGFAHVTHRAMISAITPIAIQANAARQLDAKTVRRLSGDVFSVYQLDATAYPGNSGSPVYDETTGEVVGVINMVFVKGTKESALTAPSGISYAIPARYLIDLLSGVK